jgi:hypothetical protein
MARQAGANDIDVFDAAGNEVTAVAAVIDNGDRRRLTVAMPSGLAAGTYTVRWKTLSADDGDSAEGETTFTYDPQAIPKVGNEVLKEDVLQPTAAATTGETPRAAGPPATGTPGSGDGGTSWVLVVAVAVGMFVLGSGGTFLLIQRQR